MWPISLPLRSVKNSRMLFDRHPSVGRSTMTALTASGAVSTPASKRSGFFTVEGRSASTSCRIIWLLPLTVRNHSRCAVNYAGPSCLNPYPDRLSAMSATALSGWCNNTPCATCVSASIHDIVDSVIINIQGVYDRKPVTQ
jgi:hypothetical protein